MSNVMIIVIAASMKIELDDNIRNMHLCFAGFLSI